jgi:Pentapeptide repeats (8 copies)
MNSNQLKQRYESGDRTFRKLDLSGAELSGIDLRDADFSGSDLYGAKLMDSLLNRANFSDRTNLAYADLSGANLSEANLIGANLEGANLEGAIAQGAIYDERTIFPVAFNPATAGMINAEDRDRQSRIDQTNTLKAQSASASFQDLNPAPEIEFHPSEEPSVLPSDLESETTSASAPSPLPLPVIESNRPKNSACSCVGCSCLVPLLVISLTLGTIIFGLNIFKPWFNFKRAANPFETVKYPRSACGDPLPRDPKKFPIEIYPVFVDSSSANLSKVSKQFCRDAFQTRRQDSGAIVIQVASFNSRERAQQFSEFIKQKIGSGYIGTPTQIYR